LCYFSVASLDGLFRRHGLALVHVERVPVHGGSIQVYVSRDGKPSAAVEKILAEEAALGLNGEPVLIEVAPRVAQIKEHLTRMLGGLTRAGKTVAAYGAAAKGSTLLNYTGIGRDILQFVADRSPHKQGRYMPGVHIPTVPPEKLLEARPDYVLLLTWNWAEEI